MALTSPREEAASSTVTCAPARRRAIAAARPPMPAPTNPTWISFLAMLMTSRQCHQTDPFEWDPNPFEWHPNGVTGKAAASLIIVHRKISAIRLDADRGHSIRNTIPEQEEFCELLPGAILAMNCTSMSRSAGPDERLSWRRHHWLVLEAILILQKA